MQINSEKLQTISNYAIVKGLSRMQVYRLIRDNQLNSLEIDGILFVLIDEKAENFTRKRKPQTGRKAE